MCVFVVDLVDLGVYASNHSRQPHHCRLRDTTTLESRSAWRACGGDLVTGMGTWIHDPPSREPAIGRSMSCDKQDLCSCASRAGSQVGGRREQKSTPHMCDAARNGRNNSGAKDIPAWDEVSGSAVSVGRPVRGGWGQRTSPASSTLRRLGETLGGKIPRKDCCTSQQTPRGAHRIEAAGSCAKRRRTLANHNVGATRLATMDHGRFSHRCYVAQHG